MKKLIFAAAALSLFACARPTMEPRSADTSTAKDRAAAAAPAEEAADATSTTASSGPSASAPGTGDFVVFRFTGSFRKEPLTLIQRVVAREPGFVVVDVTLAEGKRTETLRVRMRGATTRGDVVSVERIENGIAKGADVAAYDALVAKTTLAADANEAVLASEDVEIDVAGSAVKCRETKYRVRLGKKQATMRTLESESFPWGDVGAEIATADGKVLYKAEVVEVGHTAPAPAAIAATEEE